LREHEDDPFVRKARQTGSRSRAVFKLEEIDRAHGLIRPDCTIVDLGAAPGGWSQYAARRLAGRGRVLAVDILPMSPLEGVEVIEGDFGDERTAAEILDRLAGQRPQLVMSDMAPNMSGIAEIDHARSMQLAELAEEFSTRTLAAGGDFLVKVFQGRDFAPFVARQRQRFETVKVRKPKASRSRSIEVYVLARNFRL
jgi:23S rRNA (uridine2552-2'-O)-methyltransferase